jgi:hypothetical protein
LLSAKWGGQTGGDRLLKQLFLMFLTLEYRRNMENKEAENCGCFGRFGQAVHDG